MSDLAIPVGERLLHIGPFKTGTTAVQGAFHTARDRLAKHGVVYVGQQRQALRAVLAATGRSGPVGWSPAKTSEWHAVLDEVVSATDKRAVLSSEFFSDADDATVQSLVRQLGGPLVHVVVTIRPLAKVAPSQWQYHVQNGLRLPYEQWLEKALADPPGEGTSAFWHRQRHDELVRRWMKAVGPDQLTVIVVDEADRSMLLRTFESLLDLPEGFLVPEADGDPNRSLTYGEVELIRSVNVEFHRLGLHRTVDGRYFRRGAVRKMRMHPPQEYDRAFRTPQWALDRLAEVSAEMADNIAASGVRVVGDLSSLGTVSKHDGTEPSRTISVELASQAVLGTVHASKPELGGLPDDYALAPGEEAAPNTPREQATSPEQINRSDQTQQDAATPQSGQERSSKARRSRRVEHQRLADVSTGELVSVLATRVRRRLRRALRERRGSQQR